LVNSGVYTGTWPLAPPLSLQLLCGGLVASTLWLPVGYVLDMLDLLVPGCVAFEAAAQRSPMPVREEPGAHLHTGRCLIYCVLSVSMSQGQHAIVCMLQDKASCHASPPCTLTQRCTCSSSGAQTLLVAGAANYHCCLQWVGVQLCAAWYVPLVQWVVGAWRSSAACLLGAVHQEGTGAPCRHMAVAGG
jgi:hypothetical protein